jgi:hypothetical protein
MTATGIESRAIANTIAVIGVTDRFSARIWES